jgi:hypothetical protein
MCVRNFARIEKVRLQSGADLHREKYIPSVRHRHTKKKIKENKKGSKETEGE